MRIGASMVNVASADTCDIQVRVWGEPQYYSGDLGAMSVKVVGIFIVFVSLNAKVLSSLDSFDLRRFSGRRAGISRARQ